MQLCVARLVGVADRLPAADGHRIRATAVAVPARLHWHTKLYVTTRSRFNEVGQVGEGRQMNRTTDEWFCAIKARNSYRIG